jgi:Zn-dependent M16 (insulinase) family peptidase
VGVIGKPSRRLAKHLEEQENARIEVQKRLLGEDGLAKLKRKLDHAQEENNRPIPEELIRNFKVPRLDRVKFIETTTAVYRPVSAIAQDTRNEVERYLDLDPSHHSLDMVFSHTTTEFVTIRLYITTKDLPIELLPYLPTYLDLFFTLPLKRDGIVIDYETVVNELNDITVRRRASLGAMEVSEVINITVVAEKTKYEQAITLLSEILQNSVFDPKRYLVTGGSH